LAINETVEPQSSLSQNNQAIDDESLNIGLEYSFKANMLEKLLDFVLGTKSPLSKPGDGRVAMGGSY